MARFAPRVREYDTPTGRLAYVAQVWDGNRPDDWKPVDRCDHVHRTPSAAKRCAKQLATLWN